MKTPLAVLWLLVLVAQAWLWWRAVAWYPNIPERYPSRFGLDGDPVAWAIKSPGTWFLLPAIGAALALGLMVLGTVALPRLARSAPGLLNLPHKQRFLALDPDRRVQAVLPVAWFVALVAMATTALMIWALESLARGATDHRGPTLLWPGVFVVGILAGTVVMTWTLRRRLAAPGGTGAMEPSGRS
jgi:uncharacterized membrane protein